MTAIDRHFFRRLDEGEDEFFYFEPRFVVHIDQAAIRTIGEIFESKLPKNGKILDLMSSWRSHLPDSMGRLRVVGLGLNRDEMADNPALSEIVVHNLNREPSLPFSKGEFDAAILTVSVQYLIHPVEVFAEVGRVLRAGAPFVVSFSNRMFPTKAVALWVHASEEERVSLVARYFHDAQCFEKIESMQGSQNRQRPGDPVHCLVGYRRYEQDPKRDA